jgi:sulfane dehydrogenase subunit SoxC
MTDQLELPEAVDEDNRTSLSRRRFFATSAGLAGAVVAGRASAESLADVPPREDGADLSGHSERSQYVKIARVPEAGPGKRNVDPSDAINSKAPLDKALRRHHADRPAL